jgi:hypothetical protein
VARAFDFPLVFGMVERYSQSRASAMPGAGLRRPAVRHPLKPHRPDRSA